MVRRSWTTSYESSSFGDFEGPGAARGPRIDLRFASRGLDLGNTEDLWCSSECTPPCQGGGRGFKSRQVRSTPARVTRLGRVAQLVERAPEKREVTGSTPVSTTIRSSLRIFFCFPAPSFYRVIARGAVTRTRSWC